MPQPIYFAHCSRDGAIEFSDAAEIEGRICLGHGGSNWRKTVEVRARLGYDGTLLVPGVPEADSDDEALQAVARFLKWIEK